MGLICIDLFTTLDGVAQAPGEPDEDPASGFAFGGWQAPLIDEVVGGQIADGMAGMDALLLGRRTYDIFAGYWPSQDGPIAELFNRIPKYVASHQRLEPASPLRQPRACRELYEDPAAARTFLYTLSATA